MPNSFFRFKQFTIYQNNTAMKISTDGIILGASCCFDKATKILDIGTGTGLLALMAAQKSNATITAVEIDNNAYNQAINNIKKSKFKTRIIVHNGNFLTIFNNSNLHFDYIVSNPPYFSNSLKSNNSSKSIARHQNALPFEKMIPIVAKLLNNCGTFSVILPESERLTFVKLCIKNNLHICGKTTIKSFEDTVSKRSVLHFSKNILPLQQQTLVIYNKPNNYTQQYKTLTKDFYREF